MTSLTRKVMTAHGDCLEDQQGQYYECYLNESVGITSGADDSTIP